MKQDMELPNRFRLNPSHYKETNALLKQANQKSVIKNHEINRYSKPVKIILHLQTVEEKLL